MITSAELCGEIAAEAVRRRQVGGSLHAVRLHPVTFVRLISDLGARVNADKPGVMEALLTTPAGPVFVRPDADVAVEGYPRFEPPPGA